MDLDRMKAYYYEFGRMPTMLELLLWEEEEIKKEKQLEKEK